MAMRMLIDARHSEETRVAVVRNNRIEEYDYESAAKRQLKGNIYLAKVTRVEPSLQACFVDYGGNRHGFLAFSEIHPDYYQIPHEDRQALLEAEAEEAKKQADQTIAQGDKEAKSGGSGEAEVEEVAGDVDLDDVRARRASELRRRYKIQEVIKRRQIMLVQVVKEERGTKGAALTTHLSLAGRYCVLMPNSPHAGGISRKIANAADRKKLKSVMSALDVPDGMGCIIRTAGLDRTKSEIKRDFDYLLRLWDGIRDLTLKSIAPALIYEEANIIKRSIRDLYTRDIEEVLVEGEEGYRVAKDFMKLLIPSHAKRVKHYRDAIPLFHRYQVEPQLESMYSPVVHLKSGGHIVINPTEALVSIDVNSGRSTKEHNVEETAVKTNLEAADEIARQLRLRDMAGLIVIDFIDMHERSNNRSVEKRLKDALKADRARIQVGNISMFGLIEMSRQRLRPNLLEASMEICPTCTGSGVVRSTESSALAILRALEEEGIQGRSAAVTVQAPTEVAIYLLNEKRAMLTALESHYGFTVQVNARRDFDSQAYELERTAKPERDAEPAAEREVVSQDTIADSGKAEATTAQPRADSGDGRKGQGKDAAQESDGAGQQARRSRRRSRGRRGRGRKSQTRQDADTAAAGEAGREGGEGAAQSAPDPREPDAAQAETAAPEASAGAEPGAQKTPAKARGQKQSKQKQSAPKDSTSTQGGGRAKRSRKKQEPEAKKQEPAPDGGKAAEAAATGEPPKARKTPRAQGSKRKTAQKDVDGKATAGEKSAKKTSTAGKSGGRAKKSGKTAEAEQKPGDEEPAPAEQSRAGSDPASGEAPAQRAGQAESAPEETPAPRRRRRRASSSRKQRESAAPATASSNAAPETPGGANAETAGDGVPVEASNAQAQPASQATETRDSVEHTVLGPEGSQGEDSQSASAKPKRKRGWWRRALGK